MACEKLKLAEDLAWTYFEVFDALQECSLHDRQTKAEQRATLEPHEYRTGRHVSTLRFVLFLYCQNVSTQKLRNSSFTESWPIQTLPSGRDKQTRNVEKIIDNIDQLLVLCGKNSTQKDTIGYEGLKALSFLICGELESNSLPFDQIVARCADLTSFNRAFRSSDTKKLKEFITSNLKISSVSAIVGKRISQWCPKPGKALSNHDRAPVNQREVYFSRAQNYTGCITGYNGGHITDAFVRITRCSSVRLYFIGTMRTVTVEDCSDSTFVFTAVSSVVQITACSNCTFIFASRCVHLQSLQSCTIHLATPLRPFLSGSNENITFAPYHICYKALEDDLSRAGLFPTPNVWDHPFVNEKSEEKSWKLLEPKEFYYFAIPFELDQEKIQKRFIFPLPAPYANAVVEKEQVHKHWKGKIKDPTLDSKGRNLTKEFVKREFHQWLLDSNIQRQLDQIKTD